MAERDGLFYVIEVSDRFSANTEKFRTEIAAAQAAFAEFRNSIRDARSGTSQLASAMQTMAGASDAAANAQQRQTRAAREGAQQATADARAQARIERELARKAETILRNNIIEREGIDLSQKRVDSINQEQLALDRANRVAQARQVIERTNQILAERGLQANGARIQQLTAMEEAERRLARARLEEQVSSILASQGRSPAGKVLPPQQQLGPESPEQQRNREALAAKLAAQEELSRLRIRATKTDLLAQNAEYQRLTASIKGASGETQKLSSSVDEADGRANRIGFTFRRLFGILAAFTAVRAGIQGFFGLLREAVSFNQTIEDTNRGIGGLVLSLGEVRGPMGAIVSQAEQFKQAQQIATSQIRILQTEAQQTAATFEELVKAFQTAIGPGFAAGLNIDQIRTFSVQISQAATGLGVAQNQLAEEIRALLRGTITPRNTRIATALGITNEDIKRAREAGTLFDFLQSKFKSFSFISQQTTQNFSVLLTNTKDALLRVIGTGAINFFETLRKLLQDVIGILQTRAQGGFLEPNPQVLEIVRGFTAGLATAVEEARTFVKALDLSTARQVAADIGELIGVAAGAARGLFEVVTGALQIAARVAVLAVNSFRAIGQALSTAFPTVPFAKILETLLAIKGASVILDTLFGGLISSAGRLTLAFAKQLGTLTRLTIQAGLYVAQAVAVAAAWAAANVPLLLTLTAITVLVAGGAELLSSITGVNLKFETVLKIITGSLIPAFKFLTNSFKLGWDVVAFAITQTLNFIVDKFLTVTDTVSLAFAKLKSFIGLATDAEVAALEAANARASQFRSEALSKSFQDFKKNAEKLAAEMDKNFGDIGTNFNDAIANNDKARDFLTFVKDQFKSLGAELSQAFTQATVDVKTEKSLQEAKTLLDFFKQMPGVVAQTNEALASQGQVIHEIETRIREAKNALAFGSATTGVADAFRSQLRALNDADFQAKEKTLEISGKINEKQRERLNLQRSEMETILRMQSLSKADQTIVTGLVASGRDLLRTKAELSVLLQKQTELEAQVQGEVKGTTKAQQDQARVALKGIQDRIAAAVEEANSARNTVKSLEQAAIAQGVPPEALQAIRDLFKAQTDIARVETELKALSEGKLAVSKKLTEEANLQLQALAKQSIFEQQQQLVQDRVDAGAARRLAAAGNRVPVLRDLAVALNEVASLEAKKLLIQQQFQRDSAALKQAIAETQNAETKTVLQSQLNNLVDQQVLKQQQVNAELTLANDNLKKAADIVNGDFAKGFSDGIQQFANEAPTIFKIGSDFAKNALNETAAFASQAIVDALDPTKKVDLRERFARFFQGLGQQLLQQIIVLQLANLIGQETAKEQVLAAGTLLTAATFWGAITPPLQTMADTLFAAALLLTIGKSGGAVGANTGGRITGSYGKPSVQRGQGIRGFSQGGGYGFFPRPSYISPKDTIPAWLQLDEFVIRAEAARKFGYDKLHAINEGRLNPDVVQGIGTRGASRSRKAVASLAAGGAVAASTISDARDVASGGRQSGVTVAVVSPSEKHQERMLARGRSAQRQWVREDAAVIRAGLGISKG